MHEVRRTKFFKRPKIVSTLTKYLAATTTIDLQVLDISLITTLHFKKERLHFLSPTERKVDRTYSPFFHVLDPPEQSTPCPFLTKLSKRFIPSLHILLDAVHPPPFPPPSLALNPTKRSYPLTTSHPPQKTKKKNSSSQKSKPAHSSPNNNSPSSNPKSPPNNATFVFSNSPRPNSHLYRRRPRHPCTKASVKCLCWKHYPWCRNGWRGRR